MPRPDGQGAMPELCDGIYLLPGFDMFPAQHAPMVFHELMHLTGGGGTGLIVDMSDTFAGEASYAAQPRDRRLQNVSTYEYFATEVSRGSVSAMLTYQMSGAPHPTDWARTTPFLDGAGAGFVAPTTPGSPDPIAFPADMR